jgi:hypothetical protein
MRRNLTWSFRLNKTQRSGSRRAGQWTATLPTSRGLPGRRGTKRIDRRKRKPMPTQTATTETLYWSERTAVKSDAERLDRLKQLFDKQLIDAKEYAEKKATILKNL